MPNAFIYNRRISLARSNKQGGVGFQSEYGAEVVSDEVTYATGVPCSIQLTQRGSRSVVGLPTGNNDTEWNIYIPKRSMAKGSVKESDIIIDDLGVRYRAFGPWWDALGYNISCMLLSA